MAAFTVVKESSLKRIIICPADELPNFLEESEETIEGAWPSSEFKLVKGEVVEKTQEEIDVIVTQRPVSPELFVDVLASDLADNGIALKYSLPDESVWTKEDAKNSIDQAAGRARSRVVSQGNLIGDEYNQAYKQVEEWRLNGSQDIDVPNMLKMRAEISNTTLELAAQMIELAANNYQQTLESTFEIRLKGKAAIESASEDFCDIADTFIVQLNALAA